MWQWALLPICLALFSTVGIWTVFAVAVSNGSVNLTEGVPFISQCGTYNPQSCLFSQICNICAVLSLWIVVIRFQQVRDYGYQGKANIASIVLGFISAAGISILGNFQQSALKSVHLLGAFLAFFVGLAYFWVQLFLTYTAKPDQDRCWVGPARATGCTLCTILVIVMAVLHKTGFLSGAAVCEWGLVMMFFYLFGLFAAEFRHIDFHHLTVQKTETEQKQKQKPDVGIDISPASLETNGCATNADS
ncbi:modulator of macroautophagy TMEM150B [Sebastes umbrosus]|uniref:modulator of macroautophagy TMEM150B n=1 Tax=Sebastes umbrosus TaxID=72105 RepID=UPI00189F9160|nr:modulator of macroautophagy TMEM150B [Sebastes umbrosus]